MTYVEGIVDQVLRNTREHVHAGEDVVDVVMYVGEVYFALMTHIANDFA